MGDGEIRVRTASAAAVRLLLIAILALGIAAVATFALLGAADTPATIGHLSPRGLPATLAPPRPRPAAPPTADDGALGGMPHQRAAADD